MHDANKWSRILVIIGLSALLVGVIDPLEGSFVILLGSSLLTVSTFFGHNKHGVLLLWSFVLLVVGVGALFWLSALGGIGGSSGRSNWWAIVLLPYPIGWVLGIYGAIRRLRDKEGARSAG